MGSTNTPLKRNETQKRSPEMSENEDDAFENVPKTARESTAKRQRLRKGLSRNNILVPSERSTRVSASTEGSSDSALENSGRTMRGSLRIRAVVNYDMHFHPADLVLRPNHAATKAAREMAREGNNGGDEDTGAATDDDGASEDQSSQLESPETDNATDSKGATKTDFAVVVPVIPSYRATRSGRNVKAANYDMKHHPMDETLRPKAAAKRSVRFQGLSPSPRPRSISPKNPEKAKNSANGSPRTLQATHEDHFKNPPTTGWNDLGDLDRRLFQLQQGTPLESNIIPMSWCRVVKQLREEKLLSHQQLGASGGYAALKAHYEEVRHAVVRLFDAEAEEEPHNKEQVEWMCAEGFDVYRLPRGQRYWRHKRDSVLPSTTTLHDSNCRTMADGTLTSAKNLEPGEAPMAHSGSDTSHDSRLLGISLEQVVPAGNGSHVRAPEDTSIETLRTELLDSIDPLMDTSEVGELWSKQESAQESLIRDASADEEENHTDAGIDIEQNISVDSSTSSQSDEIQFSARILPGAQRAARRMHREQKRLGKAKKCDKQIFSIHAAESRRESTDTSPSPKDRPTLTNEAGKLKKPQEAFEIHEDHADMTPTITAQIAARPTSPGTDSVKENVEPEGPEPAETPRRPSLQQPMTTTSHGVESSTASPHRSVVGLWSTRVGQGENPASAASRLTAPPVLSHAAAHASNSSSVVGPYAADAQAIVRRYRPTAVDFM
ncbi:MAG: hypothetical protein Q9191_000390 [Dirinaria sp. TL-2023a]